MSAQRKNERDAYVFKEVYPKADSRMWPMQHTMGTDRFIMEGISGAAPEKAVEFQETKEIARRTCACVVLVGKMSDDYLVV